MEPEDREDRRPLVAVVDPLVLRRAAMVRFLEEWSMANGVRIVAVAPDAVPDLPGGADSYALVLLNLGALPVGEALPTTWLEQIGHALPATPIGIVSDRDAPDDSVAALQSGAMGFVPTSTEPGVAMHAFTFIMRGGSYFPPGALLGRGQKPGSRGASGGGGSMMRDAMHRPRASGLTSKQEAILLHLKQGQSNKVIARLLGLQEATVKVHMRHIMRKLGASNRTQAALAAADRMRTAA